ncbi:hypothetical protein FACS189472_15510 [Alphaproteobacteria bacterium]|nr:hypothetical protein FACS189472_15510 [Alphaproteobacteria bacterium]
MTYDYFNHMSPHIVESVNGRSGTVVIKGSSSMLVESGRDGSLQLKVHPDIVEGIGGEGGGRTIEASSVHYKDAIIKDVNDEDVIQPISVAMELDRLHETVTPMEATNVHYKDFVHLDDNDEEVVESTSVAQALDKMFDEVAHIDASEVHYKDTIINGETHPVSVADAIHGIINLNLHLGEGDGSIKIGSDSIVTGEGSTVVGNNNTVSGGYSFAVGDGNIVNKDRSFALGNNNVVDGEYSIAIGFGISEYNGLGDNTIYLGGQSHNVIIQGSATIGINDEEHLTVIGKASISEELAVGSLKIGSTGLTEAQLNLLLALL